MILIVAVVVNGNRDRDGGRGSNSSDDRNDKNGGNSEGGSRSSADWEVEQIKGMDGEETMLMMVELGMEVTAEGI
jgi:hypothetical protein